MGFCFVSLGNKVAYTGERVEVVEAVYNNIVLCHEEANMYNINHGYHYSCTVLIL